METGRFPLWGAGSSPELPLSPPHLPTTTEVVILLLFHRPDIQTSAWWAASLPGPLPRAPSLRTLSLEEESESGEDSGSFQHFSKTCEGCPALLVILHTKEPAWGPGQVQGRGSGSRAGVMDLRYCNLAGSHTQRSHTLYLMLYCHIRT